MKNLKSINPTNLEVLNFYKIHSTDDVRDIILKAEMAQSAWSVINIKYRTDLIEQLTGVLADHLRGNDPYIILDDANIKQAVKACVNSRLINGGQSCIAAKRIIVTKKMSLIL